MNERLVNVGVLTGSLVIAVGLGEVAVRMFGRVAMMPTQFTTDNLVVYRLKPNVRGHAVQPGVMDYHWTTNAQSLRGSHEYAIPKPPGMKRVVALGDSYTFGIGVDDSLTYAAQTERALRLACTDSVEVINTGAGGYGTSQELEIYERFGRLFQPDLVILGFTTNDFDDIMQYSLHAIVGDSAVPKAAADRPNIEAAKRVSEMIPGYSWLITHSALVNGLRQVYFGVKRLATSGTQQGIGVTVERQPDERAIALQRAVLRRLKSQVEASGAKLVVVLMLDEKSARHYCAADREKAAAMTTMRRLCAELSLECIDVGEWMVTSMPGADLKTLYIQGDGHFTVGGQTMTTSAIEPRVRELLGCVPTTAAPTPAVRR